MGIKYGRRRKENKELPLKIENLPLEEIIGIVDLLKKKDCIDVCLETTNSMSKVTCVNKDNLINMLTQIREEQLLNTPSYRPQLNTLQNTINHNITIYLNQPIKVSFYGLSINDCTGIHIRYNTTKSFWFNGYNNNKGYDRK